MKSTLGIISKGLNAAVNAPQLIGADYSSSSNDFWLFDQPGGVDYKFSYSGHNSSLKAYQKCAPLTAIINKKTEAYVNGLTRIVNIAGKGKGKESTSGIAAQIRQLLARPNPLQSWQQFEAQQKIYVQLFGYSLLLPLGVPVGFPKYEATSLWNIPPVMLDIEETEKLFFQSDANGIIKSIVLNYKNTRTVLQASDVYFFKDFIPSFKSLIIPESRICSLEMPINNIIGAYESRNVLINYRGALGIITPDGTTSGTTIPLKEDGRKILQDQFRNYGLKNNQWKFILSEASVKWQQMGVPTKDLMLFEEIEDDIMRICDSYNYPYRLLSSNKANSLGGSDLKEFKKLLYEDAVIPEADSMYEQWNNFFELDKVGLRIEKDYSHLAVLQEDDLKKAQARLQRNNALQIEFFNNMITLNMWLAKNGEEPMEGDTGTKYYWELVKLGWQFGKAGPTMVMPADEQQQTTNNNQQ